ncbi:MAG: LysM peptidoglycan-binding domain-containing protein [Anaerolineae bacterium]|nr:LysM peptidoglycan-binding domain-containing protein [Anaerolineae bacterium]
MIGGKGRRLLCLLVIVLAALALGGCGTYLEVGVMPSPGAETPTRDTAAAATIVALSTEKAELALRLTEAAAPADMPAPSPLGKLAYVQGGDIWTRALPDGEPHRLTQDGLNREPRWSRSGEWLAYLKDEQSLLWIMRRDGSEGRQVAVLPDGVFAWSPVADMLAYVDGQGLHLMSPEQEGFTTLVPTQPVAPPTPDPNTGLAQPSIRRIAWSPDGGWVACQWHTQRKGEPLLGQGIGIVSADGRETRSLVEASVPGEGEAILAGWTSDGRWILFWQSPMLSASILADGVPLYAILAEGGEPRQVVDTMLAYDDFLSFGPGAGSQIAAVVGGYRGAWTQKRIYVVNAENEEGLAVTGPDLAAISPAWAPDGHRLAYVAMPDEGDLVGGDTAHEGLLQRRLWVLDLLSSSFPMALTDDGDYRDERPLWSTGGSHILFARLDREDRASLWLIPAHGGEAEQVVEELTPSPGWFGYYGHIEWDGLFDWWQPPAPVSPAPAPVVTPPERVPLTPTPAPASMPTPTPVVVTPGASITRVPSTPTAAAPGAATEGPTTYIIQAGDTLGQIAERLGVSLDALLAYNGITDASSIQVGQVIRVPPPDYFPPATPPPSITPVSTPVALAPGTEAIIDCADVFPGLPGCLRAEALAEGLLAFVDQRPSFSGRPVVADLETGRTAVLGERPARLIGWSPSGERLLVAEGSRAYRVYRRDGTPEQSVSEALQDPFWAPAEALLGSEDWLAVPRDDGSLWAIPFFGNATAREVLSAGSLGEEGRAKVLWSEDGRLAWTPHMDQLARGGHWAQDLSVRGAEPGTAVTTHRLSDDIRDAYYELLDWVPGTNLILAGKGLMAASLWVDGVPLVTINADTGQIRDLGATMLLTPEAYDWHPTEAGLLALAEGGGRFIMQNKRLALLDVIGGNLRYLTGPEMAAFEPAWSPDGNTLAYVAGPASSEGRGEGPAMEELLEGRAIYLHDGDTRRLTDPGEAVDGWPRWSADGSRLLYTRQAEGRTDVRVVALDGWLDEVLLTGLEDPTCHYGGCGWWQMLAFVTADEGQLDLAASSESAETQATRPGWEVHSSVEFRVSFTYPAEWQPVAGYYGERHEGDTGFFSVGAMSGQGWTIDEVYRLESEHKLRPYGTEPTIESLQVQGQQARLILPSTDQPEEMKGQAAVIVEYPEPVTISGGTYRYFILYADQAHIREIVESLRFMTLPY